MKYNCVFLLFFSIYTDTLDIDIIGLYYGRLYSQKNLLIHVFNETPHWELMPKKSFEWARDKIGSNLYE